MLEDVAGVRGEREDDFVSGYDAVGIEHDREGGVTKLSVAGSQFSVGDWDAATCGRMNQELRTRNWERKYGDFGT